MTLARLLNPKSIAVIGGGAWGAAVVQKARKGGFKGPIWPVHPHAVEIGGEAAVSSIAQLPNAPDLAYICINREATIGAMAELSAAGCGSAICFASGFAEAEAEDTRAGDLQEALVAASGDMPFLGPNCYGLLNYLDDVILWPDEHGGIKCDRGVGILTQSSNIAINLTMQRRAVPIAQVVTLGNQAKVTMAAVAEEMLSDPRITALGLHIEGFGDIRAWERLAQAAEAAGKPIIAIKTGRTAQSQAATASHTAALAGSSAGASALLARLGIAELRDLGSFMEALKLAHLFGGIECSDIASVSCSGGEAALMADLAADHDLNCPALTDGQKTALSAALGPRVALANPLDYHTYIWRDMDRMTATYAAMLNGPQALTCFVLDIPRQDRCDGTDWRDVLTCVTRAVKETGRKAAVVSAFAETLPEDFAEQALAAGVAPLAGMQEALAAIRSLALRRAPVGDETLQTQGPSAAGLLDEYSAKQALAGFGVAIPKALRFSADEDLHLTGLTPPVALKIQGLAHKSEAGAVALNLTHNDALQDARKAMPEGPALIEEMVTDTLAELLVGIVRDPAHGFVLTLGAGGTMTEILKDTQHLLVPANRTAVETALSKLKIAPLLHGFRGKPPAHPAHIDAIMSIQDYVIANAASLEEVEVNPLLCTETSAVAVDALIRKAP